MSGDDTIYEQKEPLCGYDFLGVAFRLILKQSSQLRQETAVPQVKRVPEISNGQLSVAVLSHAVINGRNMAGESTYICQIGLIAILAHIGC
jgi:hypothetical protein